MDDVNESMSDVAAVADLVAIHQQGGNAALVAVIADNARIHG